MLDPARFRILLVEDNDDNRNMLSRRLSRKGFTVVTATDGEAGIAAAHAQTPDLILMDLSMPGMDGWEAVRRLKADENTRHIPVIALTGHAMGGDREKACSAGCDDYDTKPVEFPRLTKKIIKLLEKCTSL